MPGKLGIRRLDTAPAYGDIETRLAALCGELPFGIVSKIAALPPQASENAARRHVAESVAASRERLGARLCGLLFHNSDDLAGAAAGAAWGEAEMAAGDIPLGLSCYDAAALATAAARFPVAMAQLPGNAFDQSIASGPDSASGMEISLRSLFLQGLLLMPAAEAAARVPAARGALESWHGFCAERSLSPLAAALAVAKSLPSAYCLVGVDNIGQLEEVAGAWAEATPVEAAWLDRRDPLVIDPRRWNRD